jgi:hypothetical protein
MSESEEKDIEIKKDKGSVSEKSEKSERSTVCVYGADPCGCYRDPCYMPVSCCCC